MKKCRIFFKETFLGRTLIWAATYLVVLFQVLPALALPQGETVVNGDVTFERNGNQMTVNQGTGRAIVNYNGFDIDSGEGVRFAQPDARAAILNRVTGPGSSAIAGELSANGRVFLINPNGILFTPSAQVDVGALVASALNLSDSDFMAGNLRFYGGAGSVVNEGMLNGGFVYLVGGTVENKGTINADDVVLAAGQSVLIDKAVDGEIRVTIDGEVASSNRLASSMANDPTGLADTSSSGTNSSSVADAELANVMNQAAQGASEVWEVGTIINKGTINVSGDVGGTVLAQGKQVGQFGTIDADGLVGDGGKIDLHASDVVVLSADSVTKANAGLNGDGGQILIVGEHAATIATGARIEAKGGTQSGNGGFVETSGKESFRIGAVPDVSASHGQGGTWLIDPYDIEIRSGEQSVNIDTNFDATYSNAVLSVWMIDDALQLGNNVRISTGTGGNQAGNITWFTNANLNYASTNSLRLTLDAANNISFNGTITNTGSGSLNLTFNGDSNADSSGNVAVNGPIYLGGGKFVSTGVDFQNSGRGVITTSDGDIQLDHKGEIKIGDMLITGSGNLSVTGGHAIALANVQVGNGSINVEAEGAITAWNVVLLASNANNEINLTTKTDGDMQVGVVDAKIGNVTLTTPGSILRLPGMMITGNKLTAHAGGPMRLDTSVATLEATNSSGAIYVTETDKITLENVQAGNGLITVTAGDTITASNVVSLANNVENYINLTATNGDIQAFTVNAGRNLLLNATAGNVVLNKGVTSANGSISVLAANSVTQNANIAVSSGSGSIDVEAFLGSVTMAGGAVSQTAGGDIRYKAGQDVALSRLDASNGNVRVEAVVGNVTDANGTQNNVTANGLQLVAGGSIATGADRLETTVNTLAMQAGGNAYVDNSKGLTVGTVGPVTVNRVNADLPTTTTTMTNNLIGASAGGHLKLTVDGTLTVSQQVNAGMNLLLNATAGNVVLNAGVTSANGSISVLAANSVQQNAGGDITIENGLGTIDVEGTTGSVTMADGTVSQTAGGNIRYKAGRDVALSRLNSSNGNVRVEAVAGNVTDANGTQNNVTANGLQLVAGGSIATGTNRLQTTVNTLAMQAGGNAYVDNSKGLTVGTVDPVTVNRVNANSTMTTMTNNLIGASAGGHLKLTADGTLTVSQQVNAGTNLLLNATAGNVVLNEGVTSANGSISVLAANSVQQNAGGDITIENGLGTIDVEGTTGSVTMADGTVSQTAGGNIRYKAGQDVALSRLNASNGNVRVEAVVGNVTDANGTQNNVTANGLQLVAGGSIATGTNRLQTTVNTLAMQAGGNAYVDNSKGLTVGTVGPVTVNRVNADSTTTTMTNNLIGASAGGHLKLTVDGTLTVNQAVNAGANLLLNATAGNVVLNEGVTSANGSISVLAANSVQQNAGGDITIENGLGTIDVEGMTGSVTMADGTVSQTAGGNIRYKAGQDVALSRLNASNGNVRVEAVAGNVTDANGAQNNVTANGLQLVAGGSIATGTNRLQTTVNTLAMQAGGNAYVDNSKGLTVGTVDPVTVNRVNANSTMTTMTNNLIGASAGGHLKLTVDGTLTVNQAVNAGANLLLNATAGNVVLNEGVTSANGSISVLAANGVAQNANIAVSSGGGSIDVEGTTGSVTMADGTVSQTAGGNIRYKAGQDVALSRLNASNGNVRVEAVAGNVTDANGAQNNVTANGLQLVAGGSIATGADRLETTVNTLAMQAGGNAYVDNSKGLTVGTVGPVTVNRVNADSTLTVNDDGAIAGINAGQFAKLTANGTIVVTNAVNAGTNLLLHATAGDVVLNAGVTSANGSISVLATNSVQQNAGGDITIENGLGTIDVEGTTGSVTMADGTVSQTAGGNIRYKAGQDVALSRLNASNGNVRVEAVVGNVTDANGTQNNVTANGLQLVAGGSIATGADRLETTVNTLAMQAGGNAYVDNSKGLTVGTVGPVTVNRVNADSTLTVNDDGAIAGINAGQFAKLTANGTIVVTNAVNAGTNLLLHATAGDVVLNAGVTSANGSISVLAANSVTQNADIVVSNGSGTIDVEAFTGSATMANGMVSRTADGNIRYAAGQDVILGQLDAGTGMVAVTASNNITGSDNITASATLLKANGSISNTLGGIVAAWSGHDIYIKSTNGITVGRVGPVTVNRVNADSTLTTLSNDVLVGLTATNGSIQLVAGGTITVSNAILAASNICVVAGNNIDLNADIKTAGNGAIALWADHDSNGTGDVTQRMGTVESVDGSIYAAGFNIYQSSLGVIKTVGLGSIMVKASNNLDMAGTISSGSGDLAMGAGQMVINGTLSARRSLILRADNGSIIGDGKATAQNVGLSASQDIGTRTHRFVVDADTLATSTDGGNVYLQELTSVKAGLVRFSDIGGNGMPQCEQGSMPRLNIGDLDGINSHDYLDLAVGGNLSGNRVFARGSADISVGGEINTLDTLDINGDANLAINGDTVIDQLNIGGALLLNGGGGFSFNDLTAGQIDVTVDGTIDMGRVDAGTALFKAGGSVSDNNSMLNVSGALTIEAGGNVGDAGKPINLNVRTIGSVSGDNVYLLQNAAGDVMVDTIVARNHLELGVPNGRILDAVDDGDWASPQINIFANSARLDAQQIGERRNPLDLKIAGDIEVVNSVPGPDQGPGYVWVRLQGDVGNKVVPDYNLTVPGLIILNNQVVGGADAVMREIFRTEAFYVETPELKSKYGVFGSPYFLHSYLQISEPVAIGLIDYILYGQAKVTADPDLPPIPNIIKGGPRAGYVVRLTAKPLIP